MQIPIENIYYLLSYAWNKLDESEHVAVTVDDNTELLDLFAKVLINATRILLKRGIDKNYLEKTEEIYGVKGKLEFTKTIKSNSLFRSRTVCTFDDYSADILLNQILVSTLWRLIKTEDLDKELKGKIKSLIMMLPGITRIHLSKRHFQNIKLNRNNRFYGFVLDVSQLIFENTLPSEKEGEFYFKDFTRDEKKMNQLFEKFVFNFYSIEMREFKVRVEQIRWAFESMNDGDQNYLPSMKTDITLENNERKIIIDAKFYRETMSTYYDAQKIKSGNLYQVFSYLMNQSNPEASGMLLYPTTDEEFDLEYRYGKHPIHIKTVNLNAPWNEIDTRLREIVAV